MQKIFLILLLIIITAAACKKDKDDDNGSDTKPVASFSSPDTADVGEAVQFINLSKNAGTYTWSFGDGGISTQDEPTHVYDKEGKYLISLTAYDEEGDTNKVTKDINVKAFCLDCHCHHIGANDTVADYPIYCGSLDYIKDISDSLNAICKSVPLQQDISCIQFDKF